MHACYYLTAAVALYDWSPWMIGCSASARHSNVFPVRQGPTTHIFNVRLPSIVRIDESARDAARMVRVLLWVPEMAYFLSHSRMPSLRRCVSRELGGRRPCAGSRLGCSHAALFCNASERMHAPMPRSGRAVRVEARGGSRGGGSGWPSGGGGSLTPRGTPEVMDRVLGALPYVLPFLNAFVYARFLYMMQPAVKALLKPMMPAIMAYSRWVSSFRAKVLLLACRRGDGTLERQVLIIPR